MASICVSLTLRPLIFPTLLLSLSLSLCSFLLGGEPPECLDLICPPEEGDSEGEGQGRGVSALSLVTRAEYLYQHGCMEDAFRVAGQVRGRARAMNSLCLSLCLSVSLSLCPLSYL